MRPTLAWQVSLLIALLLVSGSFSVASAQESKSTAIAQQLTALLDKGQMDAIAAKDPSAPDLYVAALYFPGGQLLVVSARYSVPVIMNEKLAKKDYHEIYTDLNSASIANTRVFVMDMGADGLKLDKDQTRIDTCDVGSKSYVFDGDWKKQNLASEEDYNKAFADADARYAKMLTTLLAQVKK
jgi:hypothetical protein